MIVLAVGCSKDLKTQFLLILAPPFGQNGFLSSLSVGSQERQLTYISTVGVIAERQHCAHCFGVSLLHQQLNDGLAIGLNQVLTLTTQSGGQICAHLLNCFNHLLLKQCQKSASVDFHHFVGFYGQTGYILPQLPDPPTWFPTVSSQTRKWHTGWNHGHAPKTGTQRQILDAHVMVKVLKRVSCWVSIMSYRRRFVFRRFHLGGREQLGSRYRIDSRVQLESRKGHGRLQLQHGSGLLHSRAEASVDADIPGFLRREHAITLGVDNQGSTKNVTLHAVRTKCISNLHNTA